MSRRFPEDPFTLLLEAKIPNPSIQTSGNDAVAKMATHFIQPEKLNPPIYVNPLLGGTCFFRKCDVSLDRIPIQSNNFEPNDHLHYQALHRLFCSEGLRKEKYGKPLTWLSHPAEKAYADAVTEVPAVPALPVIGDRAAQAGVAYVAGKPVYRHPNLVKAMESLVFEGKGTSQPAAFSFGFDGVFPLSCQSNALRQITRQKIDNGVLHPGMEFSISLLKQKPFEAAVENANVTDDAYFGIGGQAIDDAAVAAPFIRNVTFTVKGLFLTYESIILESPDQLERLKRTVMRYYCDVALYRNNNLTPNVQYDRQLVSVPAGARLLYLAFLFEPQILYGARKNSWLSARYRFPPGLDTVQLTMTGRDGLIFKDGLQGLGVRGGRSSPSLRTYVRDLVRKGLYSRDFDAFFPPHDVSPHGYDQALLVDLTPYKIKEGTVLTVDMTYQPTQGSPVGWYLRSYHVLQRQMDYSEKTRWSYRDIV